VEARFEGGQGPEGAVAPYMEMEWNFNSLRVMVQLIHLFVIKH
jgi:hypothetical protein